MTVTLVRGDARALPLADSSVDLVVTSPPYWALRSYTDGGEHYDGQIGAEPTPAAYVDSLIECTREWLRVLKPSGSLWVNLGDKYAGAGYQTTGKVHVQSTHGFRTKDRAGGVPFKSLIGLPWRYAIRCIDDLGLILRAEVIWSKPNGLPESVTDRVRRSHETWFHFTKEPRYFSAVDAIREPATSGAHGAARAARGDARADAADRWPGLRHETTDYRVDRDRQAVNPLGKLPGSVWEVATQPLKVPAHLGVDHFAAFPMEWPRRIIQGWSPSGICTACGEGRRPVVDRDLIIHRARNSMGRPHKLDLSGIDRSNTSERPTGSTIATITGEACACPDTSAPIRPAVVLDPFGGTGTTALVAHALGRRGVSADMSADYCRLARWRTSDPSQLAAALQVEKPSTQRTGQLDLFAGAGDA